MIVLGRDSLFLARSHTCNLLARSSGRLRKRPGRLNLAEV